jgi:2-polyprenyl-3-methyl-5-hydroxy-6-metoxy-1,4-benzoquinol methylase
LERAYQYNFSSSPAGKYDVCGRERKAKTMVAVLKDYSKKPVSTLSLLNVGGSAGIIDNYLADHFHSIVSVDIDEPAIMQAKRKFKKNNLEFKIGDALNLEYANNTFDIVICSQVYEHVPSPEKMMDEILRVLAPGGVCYFAASNRLMWLEPHYNLPLLSIFPRPLAHLYVKLAHKADYYHELHYTYWGLKKLVKGFSIIDYTQKIICDPDKYSVGYMVPPDSLKAKIALFVAQHLIWLCPGYIWLLEKTDQGDPTGSNRC